MRLQRTGGKQFARRESAGDNLRRCPLGDIADRRSGTDVNRAARHSGKDSRPLGNLFGSTFTRLRVAVLLTGSERLGELAGRIVGVGRQFGPTGFVVFLAHGFSLPIHFGRHSSTRRWIAETLGRRERVARPAC